MRVLFALGLILVAGAFVSAAAETAARTVFHMNNALISAYDLWYAFSPATLIATKLSLTKTVPFLWSPVLTFILAFPSWLLLGAPGMTLVWHYRPKGRKTAEMEEGSHDFLDQLTKAAKEEGYGDELDIGTSFDTHPKGLGDDPKHEIEEDIWSDHSHLEDKPRR